MDWKLLREIVVLIAAGVCTGAVASGARIPGRVSVLESKFDMIDKKLDQLITLAKHP